MPRSQVVGYMIAIRHKNYECSEGDKAREVNLEFFFFLLKTIEWVEIIKEETILLKKR